MAIHTKRKTRSFVKWHGGKYYLARRIIELMPPHKTYVEPFLGGGSVFLNKSSVPTEYVSDINVALMNVWKVVRDHPDELVECLRGYQYTEEEFLTAKRKLESPNLLCDQFDAAANFIVVNRMSRGGMGKDFAWSDRLRGKRRPGGPVPGDINAWMTMVEEIPAISEACGGVEMNRQPACDIVDDFDDPSVLIYLDPPYLTETRTAKSVYDHEMTDLQHSMLLDQVLDSDAIIMISGYHSRMYDNALKHWTLHEFKMKNHSGQGKTKQDRTECLWINR